MKEKMLEATTKPESYVAKEYEKRTFKLDFTYREFVSWYHGEEAQLDSEGNLLTTYNPNSKWDWFAIGGRWKNLLLLENKHKVNQAKIKEVDWEKLNKPSEDDVKRWNREWEIAVNGKKKKKDEHIFVMYKKEWYIERYKTKENFIKRSSEFYTYAVITEDGVWHEKGKMGWWGASSETPNEAENWETGFYEKFVEPYLNTNYVITILDCHI